MPQPLQNEAAPFFQNYINKLQATDLTEAIEKYHLYIIEAIEKLPADRAMVSYAPGKWTLKEVLQHMIDTERIFTYRAVCIARGETQLLPGFDENSYAANSNANHRDWLKMVDEFKVTRQSTNFLFTSFSQQQLGNKSTVSDYQISVNAIGFVTIGHLLHHIAIINERYL